MKKNAIRVFLALILTVVFVIGSVATAEAAKPVRTMGWVVPAGGPAIVITMIPNSPSPGLYQPTCKFYYNDYKAWGYKYQWYKADSLGPEAEYYPISEMQYEWFEGKHWQNGDTNIDVSGPEGQTLSGKYKVEVWLLKKNGKEIRSVWITAGLGFF
jgi:hypothetical protein